jgi:ABC-type tungstate transport system substrate-binding protein
LAVVAVAAPTTALVHAVEFSFAVGGSACVIAASFGLLAGAGHAVARFRGLRAVLAGPEMLRALPSVGAGLAVGLLLSRSGPLADGGCSTRRPVRIFVQMLLARTIVIVLAGRGRWVARRRRQSARWGERRCSCAWRYISPYISM